MRNLKISELRKAWPSRSPRSVVRTHEGHAFVGSDVAIGKRLRFEVFKRDSFTCQYCGLTAPKVLLEVDHITARANGGNDDILNLITACGDCNRGKSALELSDDSAIVKRQKQLVELQKRKEQLDMMFQWHRGLASLEDETIEKVADLWSEMVPANSLTDEGKKAVGKLIKRYGLNDVIDAMKIVTNQYSLETQDQICRAFNKIGGVCRLKNASPDTKEIYYIRGILRNRIYVNENWCLPLLKKAVALGASIESLKELAIECSNWTQWRNAMEQFIESAQESESQDAESDH